MIKKIDGSVCAPRGFVSAAVSCGIKQKDADRLDLALIFSQFPTVGAAVFTTNQVKAAPVLVSADHFSRAEPRAIIVNSGNANACTGETGRQHALAMVNGAAESLRLAPEEVLVCSTGIIGLPMPIERILARIQPLTDSLGSSDQEAALAIMTSDTRPKYCAVEYIDESGETVRIGGIAKGAGMIHPNMATMLGFVTTDAALSKKAVIDATRAAVAQSFNCISVDGDTSTNDTVIVLANGQSGAPLLEHAGGVFQQALNVVMLDLAKKIVGDGERVTKLVTVSVTGAAHDQDAEKVARAVGNSNLVKCSWNGNDPNWGRIIHAAGYSGACLDPAKISISLNGLPACTGGLAAPTPLAQLSEEVKKREFTVAIDLGFGSGSFTLYAADLSAEYVEFNREEYSLTPSKSVPGANGPAL